MFKKFALFCVLLAFCVVVLEAYVRISSTGLSCPDWFGCKGTAIADDAELARTLQDTAARHAVNAARPRGELVLGFLKGVLGASILFLAVLALRAKENARVVILLSLTALGLAVLETLPDIKVIELKASPLTVSIQRLIGFLTLGVLYWIYLESASQPITDKATPVPGKRLRWMACSALLLAMLQTALGLWMSANHAGPACPDFPTCLGSWWPAVDYRGGFQLWDGGAGHPDSGILPQAARAAIHWTHRLAAALMFFLLSAVAISITSNRSAATLSRAGVLLSFLLLLEISLGIAIVILRLPLPWTVGHNAVGALLVLTLVYINFHLGKAKPAPSPAAQTVVEEPRDIGETKQRSTTAESRFAIPAVRKAVPAQITPELEPEGPVGRLKTQLAKTRTNLTSFLANLSFGKKAIDQDLLEQLEARLLMADVGVSATNEIIRNLTASLERHELRDAATLTSRLREYLYAILAPCSRPLRIPPLIKPFVILVVGVNGVGKTTTIGKLAKRLQDEGHSVMLAAGDTFRAAAVEQLQSWGGRNGIPVVAQQTGADAASVVYDAMQSAQAREMGVLIVDTAGRLHTKSNLMDELKKIKRIIGKLDATAPHEVLLILDAGTGQNAISQARLFNEAIGLTGIALTKLDGTAKGGVIFALASQFKFPIRWIGIGEGVDDLQDFDAKNFVDALFGEEAS